MVNVNGLVHSVGVAFGFIAGIAAIVAAIVFKQVAFAAWGVAFLAGSIIAVASGAKATPGGSLSGPTVKATYKQIPDMAFYAILGLCVLALIMTFIFPPWR